MAVPASYSSAENDAGTCVLLVDDYPIGLYIKAQALTEAGFCVMEASTGEEALRIVSEHRPAVVILDVRLPDTDGITVCRAIRNNPATSNTMVLQVSAYYTTADDQVRGLESGADGYLPGDVAPALLIAAVRALLRTRRAEQALSDQCERLRLIQALQHSEEKLRALAAGLLTAQEDERRNIAREVHDGFCQRLAVLSMQLTNLQRRLPHLQEELEPMMRQVSALGQELRNLSHSLHPSGLQHLGLEASLRKLCEEFEETHNLATHCLCLTGEREIPASIASTLYRIAQEALRNVVKHAGDARVTVTLSGNETELQLTIQDDGCGFDPALERRVQGLGLISIEERAALVGGHLNVDSAPGEGTTVTVRVPWPNASERARGHTIT